MSYTDTRTGITFGYPDGADNYGASLNATLQRLSYLLVGLVMLRTGENNPPANPSEGDRYAVGDSATGAWSGYSQGDIAIWGQTSTNSGLGWQRFRPYVGLSGYDRGAGQEVVWDGTSWGPTASANIRNQLNFDPNSISGSGTRTDPWTVNFPEDKDTQADWLMTTVTNAAYIKNLPSWLRNLRSSDVLSTLSNKININYTGSTRGGTHSERLVSFSPTPELQRLSHMGFEVGARAIVTYSAVQSATRWRLRVTQGSDYSRGSYQPATPLSFGRRAGREGLHSITSSLIRVYIDTYKSGSNDNFGVSGELYYGLVKEDA